MKDFDHDLAALRFVIEKKARGEHLKKILAENAEYTSVSWKETFTGPQEIIRLLNHVQDTGSEKEFAHYAVIIKNDGHAKEIENNKVGIFRRYAGPLRWIYDADAV